MLLTNLMFSITHHMQSDEIDIVAIGPPGVRVIEVKHWSSRHRSRLEAEADRLTMKARRIGTTLRRNVPSLPHVEAVILLTPPAAQITKLTRYGRVRGVRILGIKGWREAAGADSMAVLAAGDIRRIAKLLARNSGVVIDDSLRRLAGYVNLELVNRQRNGFHSIYRGVHSVTRDQVRLHLYDFSAPEGKRRKEEARRCHDELRRLQQYAWAPRILDTFQNVPEYPGEMSFFTLIAPDAPPLVERSRDPDWTVQARLSFARSAVQAVRELHDSKGTDGQQMVHGNLSAHTILVLHDNTAALRGFGNPLASSDERATDPDDQNQMGLDLDCSSLCAALNLLFRDSAGDRQAGEARRLLEPSFSMQPSQGLEWIDRSLGKLVDHSPTLPVPPAQFWTERQEVSFRDQRYRIVARLGSGGAVRAFKVVELHRSTGEEVGTFVAKAAHDEESGTRMRRSHQLIRSAVGRQPGLSTVFEVASEWNADEITALLSWVEGTPLSEFAGVLPLLARDHDMDASELAARWMQSMCEALDVLHRNGLVHGDVSPHNMIVSGEDLVLTDYDCVTRIADPATSLGTRIYCSPTKKLGEPVSSAHDVHALAASFFHILFDREPFSRDADGSRTRKLDWRRDERNAYPALADFLDRAVDVSRNGLASAGVALEALRLANREHSAEISGKPDGAGVVEDAEKVLPLAAGVIADVQTAALPTSERQANEVPWLAKLLESYPGSRRGNSETRGLDTDFARKTYVETDLEAELWQQITEREVSLVILCGNAGDGKTALLQHLAQELGMGRHRSSERIVDRVLQNGTHVRMNMDGSASHEGRSANELLDDFLEPFREGVSRPDRVVHLLAVNDGRLLEWIHSELRNTPLKRILLRLLAGSGDHYPRIRLHHLNQKSRVGKVSRADGRVTTGFLDRLLQGLYGGEEAETTWEPCTTCSARERCRIYEAARVFGPDTLADKASLEVRMRARERLFAALQAVHLRGETHLTVRELRSVLVYILFGTRYCKDYHEGISGDGEPSYWDRAFDPKSPRRQGDVLRELVHFDPALEAHPKIDRQLLRQAAGGLGPGDASELASLRRRAYFEWTVDRIRRIAPGEEPRRCLGLAGGSNLNRFRRLPLLDDKERRRLCHDLCRGIARIGDLPPMALNRGDVVPLRITPRTPTETAFWTEKPIARFRLEAESLAASGEIDEGMAPNSEGELHRAAHLIYEYSVGNDERLTMGADLFHRLLRLGKGYQLAGISTDDTFARLHIFLQRLVRENDREIMAWNPIWDEMVHRISIHQGAQADHQVLVIQPDSGDGGDS